MRKIVLWSAFFILSFICVAWFVLLIRNTADNERMRYGVSRFRAERAEKARGPVVIGVAGAERLYVNVYRGIELARDEINAAGGINGRKIVLVKKDDRGSVITGRQVAQEFADNIDVVAVIGHPRSDISVPVSVIYQYYGVLMLSPLSKSSKLTEPGHKLIFRNIPNDADIGAQMAQYVSRRKFNKMAIYYVKDEYGIGMSSSFESGAASLNIDIADRLFYENNYTPKHFQADVLQWKKFYSFDAIFLAGLLPQAARFIVEARKIGITVPIIAEESICRDELITLAGKSANGIVVMSVFDVHAQDPAVRAFRDNYSRQFHDLPDSRAAQGYDALMVLAYAMRRAKSTVPEKVANALHTTRNWPGVTGQHTFNAHGDVVGKKLLKMIIRNEQFVHIPED